MLDTQEQITVSRGWWQSLLRPQNILAFGVALVGLGGYYQDYKYLKERVARIESRLDKTDGDSNAAALRSAIMSEQLSAIQHEISLLRDEVHGVGREVKKIQ